MANAVSKQRPDANGYFITGSDTGVGKTWITCQLISQLSQQHSYIKVRKPVESGCTEIAEGQLLPTDGNALYQANGQRENLDIITPYRFRAALAPDRAAHLEGMEITLAQLLDAVNNSIEAGDLLLVEGAGGFYSPIACDALNADLARELGLGVIIVVDDRLGAINQALLTIRAVVYEGLSVAAVILNQTVPQRDDQLDNLNDLASRQQFPVFQCSFDGTLQDIHLS